MHRVPNLGMGIGRPAGIAISRIAVGLAPPRRPGLVDPNPGLLYVRPAAKVIGLEVHARRGVDAAHAVLIAIKVRATILVSINPRRVGGGALW